MINKTIGGERLGSGNRMSTALHNYERSTFDLSRIWRSTMNVGTLIPFFTEVGLNGDTFDIDLSAMLRTVPTQGALFGSFKLQMDVFKTPIRLYNGLLHNNAINIGMDMSVVKMPTIELSQESFEGLNYDGETKIVEMVPWSNTCLSAFFNKRGIAKFNKISGTKGNTQPRVLLEKVNALPYLAYYDIFKNYYANKQESKAYVLGGNFEEYKNGTFLKWQEENPFAAESITDFNIKYKYLEGTYADEVVEVTTTANAFDKLFGRAVMQNCYDDAAAAGKIVIQEISYYIDNFVPFEITENINLDREKQKEKYTKEYNQFFKTIEKAGGKITVEETITLHFYRNLTQKEDISREFSKTEYKIENEKIKITLFANEETSEKDRAISILKYLTIFNLLAYAEDKEQKVFQIIPFNLENIDEMRKKILQITDKNIAVEIDNKTDLMPYAININTETTLEDYTNNECEFNGICLKTYQSDIFNNWLQKEWIDTVTTKSTISTSTGSFTMDSLNLAKKVYDLMNRIAVSGGSYEDWQEAVWGEEALRRPEQPIYCGGYSAEIVFDEVVSQAGTESEPLGTIAGRGNLQNPRNGHITVKCEEPCILMGIVSITPRIDYEANENWWMNEIVTLDDLHKPALDGIGYQDLMAYQANYGANIGKQGNTVAHSVTSKEKNLAIGKTPAWINYQTAVNELHGEFCDKDKTGWMVISRDYTTEIDGNNIRTDFTTYIDPRKFNYPFAYQELDAQNFWLQIGTNMIARRKMSAKAIPNV